MSFRDLQLNTEYRTGCSNVVNDFFVPLLSRAVAYRRAVGFFSSTALIQVSKGLAAFAKNGGKMQLIVSPHLSAEDIEAIKYGYEQRSKVIESAVLRRFNEPKNEFEAERLNLLATMVAEDRLDIKIALTKSYGMYHEKLGLLRDDEHNIVAFSGSANESETAFSHNYEVVDAFCSWHNEYDCQRAQNKEFAFHKLWTQADDSIIILDFPKVATEKLLALKRDEVDYDIDKKDSRIDSYESLLCDIEIKPKDAFRLSEGITLHTYQQNAISKWIENGYRGIFDMATGTGKTYTGLGALAELSKRLCDNLATFIVCPYQHLVEQWVEDINAFNVKPLICYSKYEWRKKLKYLVDDFRRGDIQRFCAVACNASFKLPEMQEAISKLKGNSVIVVDEVHNFGSEKLQQSLSDKFKYRLGLSATIVRHRDEEGTKALFDYFGEKCIEYTLKDAIDNNFLTRYKYYPVVVTLNSSELNEYVSLTEKIIKIMRNNGFDEKLPRQAEMLMIKRARVVAGAQSKIEALRQEIMPYKGKNNILVYCGATRVTSDDEECSDGGRDKRQIEAVTKMLCTELGMKASMFTSEEGIAERKALKELFSEGEMLQALVAIKCLDEGVNIPGIKVAFILASSTNPKEYIQRRGRVLRKAEGKEFAEIYDFIVMPSDIYSSNRKIANIDAELSLVKRELERMKDFRDLCENPYDSFALQEQINEYYQTNYIGGKDYGI